MAKQDTSKPGSDVGGDASTYELIDADLEREPHYQNIIATVHKENVYTTSSTAVHHAEGGERRGRKTSDGTKVSKMEKIPEKQKEGTCCKTFTCIFISIVAAIVLLVCIAVLFAEVAKLKQTATPQQPLNQNTEILKIKDELRKLENATNHTTSILLEVQQMNSDTRDELQYELRNELENSTNELRNDLNTLYQQISAMLDKNTDQLNRMFEMRFMELSQNISLLQNKTDYITTIITGKYGTLPVTSCTALPPSSLSGYYWVRASNGSAVHVYCDMTLSCGNITGGWMRVAELHFNRSTKCPSCLHHVPPPPNISTCRIASPDAGCASVLFSTSGVTYNQVCGKVLAYQINTTDAFAGAGRGASSTIDGNYIDGVSLTHGTGPRKHIWTFAAAIDEYGSPNGPIGICNCSHQTHTGVPSPAFVGQDYFCDSGLARFNQQQFPGLVTTSPLWDGAGCGPDSTCCTFNNPPWFHKQLPSPTSDDIEMRVCRNQERLDEDIAISSVQIYIR